MSHPFASESDPSAIFEYPELEELFEFEVDKLFGDQPGTTSVFEEEELTPGGATSNRSGSAAIPSISLGLDYAAGDRNINPNWARARAKAPIDFGIIQSNWGLRENPAFKRDWSKMKAAGIVRGAYLFLRFPHPKRGMRKLDPVSQAQAFIKTVGSLDESDLPPSLDVEFPGDEKGHPGVSGGALTGMKKEQLLNGVRAAWKVLKDHYKSVAPILYTSGRVWAEDLGNLRAPDLLESPLWLAKYCWRRKKAIHCPFPKKAMLDGRVFASGQLDPEVPPPWGDSKNWWIHQYQGDARALPGFNQVDMNRFNTMQKGETGERVKWVQRRLGVPENGRFDSTMESALSAFKSRKGLGSDCRVDVRTFAYLCWSNPTAASTRPDREIFSISQTRAPEDAFEFEVETPEPEIVAPESQLEWTEDELQYSIIVSPTSLGDDRFRISARSKRPSTLMFPFNTICLLERNHLDGKVSRATGTLIAPQVVLTAKHCLTRLNVRTAAEGKRFTSIRVTPGADLSAARNQRPADPQSITAPVARFRVHPTLDFGVIILPTPFRRPVQFMRLQSRSDVNTATLLTIAGYPCDKPRGTMWGHSEKIELTDISPTHLSYTIDTCPGHSGSPIWLLGDNAVRLLLGVHTNGPARCVNDPASGKCRPTGAPVVPVVGKNGGVRVTCEVIDYITAWCREFHVAEPTIESG